MNRRTTSMLVSGGLLVVLVAIAAWLPVPYVLLQPGPTFNTIGEFDGEPLITVDGAPTFPTDGELLVTTVSESGGPFSDLTLVEALWGWWDGAAAVLPESLLYPPDVDREVVEEQNATAFVDSQAAATAAALNFVGEPIRDVVIVDTVDEEGPSKDKLEPDDEIVSVEGRPATSSERVARIIGATKPGDDVVFELRREGKPVEATVTTEASDDDPDKARVGITLGESVQGEDVTVTYGLDDVGGPSAGLMFSLGIIDELTEQSLTDGKAVAGTGTIDAEGLVGPIGGVQQKVVGAKRDGAEYFLTPLLNCRDAVAAAPEGLQLVRVDNLQDAVDALEAIREGDPFPRC